MRVWPGAPFPLGATWDGHGVNFALFSRQATGVDLCLFDSPDGPERTIPMKERTDFVWHAYLPDVRPGRLYGYRVHGPYAPEEGARFNRCKLLADPYAKALVGGLEWDDALYGYDLNDPDDEEAVDQRDSAPFVPKSMVMDPAFTWGDDRPPRTPWNRTVIYECHVRGMTMRHPNVPKEVRGTYLGLASDPIIDHLTNLGVTAVELLPVHHSVSERPLVDAGLSNYWGYNTLGFFAPDPRFATGDTGHQVVEFKSMVKALHRAGIEVILDVVFNHTAEGNHLGPTLSLKGIDNTAYYRLDPESPSRYVDFTGTGNTLNTEHPRTLQLVMDSLRYWVTEMRVDGFRFDLASALAREPDVDPGATFFDVVGQSPVLSEVKLIAEPWDAAEGGYQLGNFPHGWAEWNGKYRDCVRRFWKGDPGQIGELASRLSGSSDLFEASDRGTYASINFVTSHDGFTLHDLVSYEEKHNEANAEDNRDGDDANWSRNWGEEGPTESSRVNNLRQRLKRNFLTTLVFSQGVPMLLAGDEMGRTQRGNNNAYCQDNEISWVDWDLSVEDQELLAFTQRLLRILRSNPVLRRRRFFGGEPVAAGQYKDVTWIRADGEEMEEADWSEEGNHSLGMLVDARAVDEVDDRGRPIYGSTVLLLLNGGPRSRRFTLPRTGSPGAWEEVVNTTRAGGRMVTRPFVNLVAHSAMLLRTAARP